MLGAVGDVGRFADYATVLGGAGEPAMVVAAVGLAGNVRWPSRRWWRWDRGTGDSPGKDGTLGLVEKRKATRGPRKPTQFSVTAVPCTCRFLERASEEPTSPIVFDAHTSEFHMNNVGKGRTGHTVVYHRRFCGGAAPLSKRRTLFATITPTESTRLYDPARGDELSNAQIQEALEDGGRRLRRLRSRARCSDETFR
jgi:hypothetical protein